MQDDGDDFLWVGFDTAHWNDGKDIEKIREYFGEERAAVVNRFMFDDDYPARTLDYCIDECRGIVDRIIELFDEEDE